ncbi:MAG: sigma 54-interacting transcriptional regulator [Desulfuromonadales bacterium]
MQRTTIPIYKNLASEIEKSHARSRQYGVNPNTIVSKDHVRLSSEALSDLRQKNAALVQVASDGLRKLYELFRGAGFTMALVHHAGCILDVFGDPDTLAKWAGVNYSPGYRWLEKDVGTGAIPLCIELQTPVQVHDKEHYCKRSHGRTGSASPVFDADDRFIAVISLTGEASKIHLHTLGMIVTAAEGITRELKLLKSTRELQLSISYLNTTIESIDSGIMIVDEIGLITRINGMGKTILRCEDSDIIGKQIQSMLGVDASLRAVILNEYVDREVFLKGPSEVIQVFITAKPIGESGEGFIFRFHESGRVRKLVNKIAWYGARFTIDDILGSSNLIVSAKKLARKAAPGESSILILGETGTGKELFAHAIHNLSKRHKKPFIAINCGAIPRELIESELFGYAEGAFTGAQKGGHPGKFELANEGTIFLDEIGDMPADMQVKLLRVLQSGEVARIGGVKPTMVNVRIIAATNINLKTQLENKTFRADLFYRLNVVPIILPSLREITEDIMFLSKLFLKRYSDYFEKGSLGFSQEAESALTFYHWPGNIRELGNIIERAVNLVDGPIIGLEHLGIMARTKRKTGSACPGKLLEEVERQTILEIMASVENNITNAAKILGLTRATLYKKLKLFDFRKPGLL